MPTIQAGAGAKLYIATAKGAVLTTAGAYAALTYRECEQTEAIGALGDTTAEVNFTGLGDARVQKLKGSSDAGNLDVSMAFNDALFTESPSTGQELLLTASEDTTTDNFRFKRTIGAVTEYFSGKVGTWVVDVSGADNIVMLTSQIRVNSAIIRA